MPTSTSLVELSVPTSRRSQLVDIGPRVQAVVEAQGIREGVVHLWSMHTTCALTVNENADPDVATDMTWKMDTLVPRDEAEYRHGEGNSDSHVKTSLFGPGLTLIVSGGQLVLGTWQGVFLAEWDGPRTRTISIRPMAAPAG
ncbi:MAG: YjbQ family protein [Gemmatimonadales bacterium]|nr:MAG: YjbQ family protein [Gemmatimonadales bacterium]